MTKPPPSMAGPSLGTVPIRTIVAPIKSLGTGAPEFRLMDTGIVGMTEIDAKSMLSGFATCVTLRPPVACGCEILPHTPGREQADCRMRCALRMRGKACHHNLPVDCVSTRPNASQPANAWQS